MSRGRIHCRAQPRPGRPAEWGVCGLMGGGIDRYTTDEERVTCRICRKKLREGIEASVYEPPPTGPQPVVMGCRHAANVRDPHQPIERRKTWPTWRMAVRSYVTAADDGWAMKSTSDPSRFEALPQSSQVPEGDKGQRAVDDLYAVGRALSLAFDGPYVTQTQPRLEVSETECMRVLVWMVVGKPIERPTASQTGETRRTMLTHRIEQDRAELAADVSRSVGHEVTAGMVTAIVRAGGLRIEQSLERGGWVTQRDEALHRVEESDMTSERGKRLQGQKEIADYLGRDVRTVQRMKSWDPPIPIKEFGGIDIAWTADLDKWIEDEPQASKETA